ncbi:MAG: flagellar FlbD family protein [Deltaproteobacteria bacterium]
MIRVTKFDGRSLLLNPDLIQSVEETPDTVITLTTGLKILVKESSGEVVSAFEEYKRKQYVQSPSSLRKAS